MASCSMYLVFTLVLVFFAVNVACVCSPQTACFPAPIDVSGVKNSTFNVNSTCGNPLETYCSADDCSLICNASDPAKRHPKAFMLDDYSLPTFWKSRNLEAPVTIQLDLPQKLILHQVTTTFQIDVPNSMYLQRSQDFGKTYSIIAYFARNCLTTFSRGEDATYKADTVCLRIGPDQISTKTINYVPRTSAEIQREVKKAGPVRDYFIFTNLRLVLNDYLKPSGFNINQAIPGKYFFSIKDFDVQGSCYCNGMSDSCDANNFGNCVCQKNTAGSNCQHCLPLFNNKLWQYGIACQACNCSGLASSCVYDAAKGYGICQNCTQNTTGDFCHSCQSGFHRSSNNLCVDCGCDIRGANTTTRICHESIGSCYCKVNVQGSKCNSCKDQFWGLSASNLNGCQACNCRTSVTVNGSNSCNKETGQCPCMPGFAGRDCNTCQIGYYSTQAANPTVCTACHCHPSGSRNTSCSNDGSCYCRPFYSGNKCQSINSTHFSPSVEQLLFPSSNAMVISSASYYMTYTQITSSKGVQVIMDGYSLGLDVITRTSTIVIFNINIPSTSGYQFVVRYQSSYTFRDVTVSISRQSAFAEYSCSRAGVNEIVTQNNPVVFRTSLLSANRTSNIGTVCLSAGRYTVTLTLPYNSSTSDARILLNSLLILPSLEYSALYLSANNTNQASIRHYHEVARDPISWNDYRTNGGPVLSSLFGPLFTEAVACQCDSIGSVKTASCAPYGGKCSCKQFVTGRRCNACLANHYNFTSGNGCTACGCHVSGSINGSCSSLTGDCTCRPNVIGNKCNQCRANHYGISSGSGCLPCNCSPLYSTGQQCLGNGTCICKPGIGGNTCSACTPGYFNLTSAGCTACSCNTAGSINSVCNVNNASCQCKRNSAGEQCDRCKSGYYGFSPVFPDACLKCQCSGKTAVCTAASQYYVIQNNNTFSVRENNLALDNWIGVNGIGLRSGVIIWNWNIFRGYAKLTDTQSDSELYYAAPSKYLGDKSGSYMLKLRFDMLRQNATVTASSLKGDVILKGNGLLFSLVTSLPTAPAQQPTFTSYEVTFDARNWRINRTDGPQATAENMIETLRNLRSLWIRAKWSQANNEYSGLTNVRMEYSQDSVVTLTVANNVENCTCPIGYTGLSCERCAAGYTRLTPYGSAYTTCVPCNCNRHSSTCDAVNGTCLNCQHFTEGQHCERCIAGHYGNATVGTANDCRACPCPGGPGTSNQFSPTCELSHDGLPNCTACQVGYTGRRCNVCSDGYSGNPLVANGRCTRCICNRNIDTNAVGNCNRTTGECLKCMYNTTGSSCQWCKIGFFGNALSTNPSKCRACSCNVVGSVNRICNNVTGFCTCKPNVQLPYCERCNPNTYNFTSGVGCSLCNCHPQGSRRLQCLNNGTCVCKPNVTGEKCDKCMAGFYDLARGCLPCNCSQNFTLANTTCNPETGQCQCKSSRLGGLYSGRRCDQCGTNAIGNPPDCALCITPCYDNWQRYIAQETRNLANLMSNTSVLLAKFGGMSYSQINSQLMYLNGNLSYALNTFEGAQYDTKAKETQFKQIETSIITFETSLNKSEAQLATTEQYFTSTSSFNGSVKLDSTTPSSFPSPFTSLQVTTLNFNLPASASPSSVSTMAQGYLTTASNNNITGHLVYSTTMQTQNQIISANQSINQAATRIAESMRQLTTAATERARASVFLSGSFQTTFQANARELQSINTMVESIKVLLNSTAKTHSEATSTLSTAQATINAAETEVNTRRTEANAASQSASQLYVSSNTLQTNARNTQSSASLLKSNSDAVLFDAQQATSSLATSVNKVSRMRNQTNQITATANQVMNQTIPVSLARIQLLSNQITSTSIDETQINRTLVGATDGLKNAQNVQKLSEQAVNASQTTLKTLQDVESYLNQSETLRNSTRSIHTSNDLKANEIKNITNKIENDFKGLQSTGAETLALVNASISQIDANMMCFANAKNIVDNATLISQSAQSLSAASLQTHQNNTRMVNTMSTQINTAYVAANKNYAEVQQAQSNATQLLQDVTEAERLLAQFIAQNEELRKLQTESTALEAELDKLVQQFDEASQRLGKCNRN